MAFPQKEPLRALSDQEKRELQRVVKATSERLDVVRRAKAVLAVAGGHPFTEAALEAGLKSGDGVGKLVKRFNQSGLAALQIAAGRGRKVTYTSAQRGFSAKCSERRTAKQTRRRPGHSKRWSEPYASKDWPS